MSKGQHIEHKANLGSTAPACSPSASRRRASYCFSLAIVVLAAGVFALSFQVKKSQYVCRSSPGWYLSNIKMMESGPLVADEATAPALAVFGTFESEPPVVRISEGQPSPRIISFFTPPSGHLRSPPPAL